MINKLFLGGGGDIDVSYAFDELFFCSLPPKACILYIPVAMATTMAKKEACFDWFSKLISNHSSNERDIDFSMWNSGDNLPNFHDYDAVYVGGGNTYRLLSVLKKTGMLDLLRKFIDDGGIYYGGSAGAIIAGKSLLTVGEENLENYSNHIGMGLINNISVFPHFSNSEEQRYIVQNICINHALRIAALPENSGFVVDGRKISVYGNVYLYEQEKKTLLYTSGENIE